MEVVVLGRGWIGGLLAEEFDAVWSKTNICDHFGLTSLIRKIKPDVVINAAGKTGKPNIDWCEENTSATMASNVAGPLVLANVCREQGTKLVHLSSGCLWQGGGPYKEEDVPQVYPSFYSMTKHISEALLLNSEITPLIVRIRMPISSTPHPRNLITKLSGYNKLIGVENSYTVVEDFIPILGELIYGNYKGVFNVVNEGTITHWEIMDKYKAIVDPNYEYEKISKLELTSELVTTGRSDCTLSTDKLKNAGLMLPEIGSRLDEVLKEYKEGPALVS